MRWLFGIYTVFRWLIGLTLIVSGLAVWIESSGLMSWLIWEIGEERALGKNAVIHLQGGGTLLTNPSAMMLWTIPFWALGFVMLVGGTMLVLPCVSCKCAAKVRP